MRKYILLAAVLLIAAVAAGFFDGAKITVPVVSPQAASAMNDPGQEGQGGECPYGCEVVQTCVDIFYPNGDWLGCLGY